MSVPQELTDSIAALVDKAMQDATRVTAYWAACHHPQFWYHVRDRTTEKILALVDEDRQRLF
jgi:hypothetical protein